MKNMEQKVIECSPAWLKDTIDAEFKNGWFVAALTPLPKTSPTSIQKYIIVLQRYGSTHQYRRNMGYEVNCRTGYIAKP